MQKRYHTFGAIPLPDTSQLQPASFSDSFNLIRMCLLVLASYRSLLLAVHGCGSIPLLFPLHFTFPQVLWTGGWRVCLSWTSIILCPLKARFFARSFRIVLGLKTSIYLSIGNYSRNSLTRRCGNPSPSLPRSIILSPGFLHVVIICMANA